MMDFCPQFGVELGFILHLAKCMNQVVFCKLLSVSSLWLFLLYAQLLLFIYSYLFIFIFFTKVIRHIPVNIQLSDFYENTYEQEPSDMKHGTKKVLRDCQNYFE